MKRKLSDIPEKVKYIASVVSALVLLGGTVVSGVALVSNKISDKIDAKLDPIAADLTEVKLDTTRLQLLHLIEDQPENESEILKVAKHYFTELGGDWYVTDLFNAYCIERNIHVDWEMPL